MQCCRRSILLPRQRLRVPLRRFAAQRKRPGFFDNPLASTLHALSDVVDFGKDVVVGYAHGAFGGRVRS